MLNFCLRCLEKHSDEQNKKRTKKRGAGKKSKSGKLKIVNLF